VTKKPRALRKKTLLIVSGVVVLLLAMTYLGRGYIRATAVPAYAQTFYMPGVSKKFDENLTDATRKLESYGAKYNTNYDECWSGGNAMFENFRETVTCIKSLESNATHVTDGLRKQWKIEGPKLEKQLLANGWQKQYNTEEPIAELLVRDYGPTVKYAKDIGKVQCEFSITYAPRSNTTGSPQDQVWSHESCQRDVKFFGGYY
jgi:hypothetical protein